MQGEFVSIDFAAVGTRIKALRGSLSQAEFAERLTVDRKTVVGWEAGKRLPDGSSLLRLALEFGADLNHLLLGQSESRRLSAEEETVVAYFREATPDVRRAALGALIGAAQHPASENIKARATKNLFGVAVGKVVKE